MVSFSSSGYYECNPQYGTTIICLLPNTRKAGSVSGEYGEEGICWKTYGCSFLTFINAQQSSSGEQQNGDRRKKGVLLNLTIYMTDVGDLLFKKYLKLHLCES